MNKFKKIISITAAVLFISAILFVPYDSCVYDDGGTREYKALAYKAIVWNTYIPGEVDENGRESLEIYHKTSIYFFPRSRKSLKELWEIEVQKNPDIKRVESLTSRS